MLYEINRVALPIAAMLLIVTAAAQDSAPTPNIHADAPNPPIAIPFTLQEPGIVTLVIEDASGHRIRNLIGETPFPAGPNTVYWDGLDEATVVPGSPNFTYSVQGKLVAPGT